MTASLWDLSQGRRREGQGGRCRLCHCTLAGKGGPLCCAPVGVLGAWPGGGAVPGWAPRVPLVALTAPLSRASWGVVGWLLGLGGRRVGVRPGVAAFATALWLGGAARASAPARGLCRVAGVGGLGAALAGPCGPPASRAWARAASYPLCSGRPPRWLACCLLARCALARAAASGGVAGGPAAAVPGPSGGRGVRLRGAPPSRAA
jgi:hypothetical protein